MRAAGERQVSGGGGIAALGNTPRLKNSLLVRDDVGKPRSSTYDLPEDGFAYGKPTNDDVESAREVTMHWVAHQPSKPPEMNVPDFIDFNKKATAAKVTTSKDMAFFRKECGNLLPRGARRFNTPGKALIPSDVVPGFTYGQKVRPSTPIQEVISARFADRSEKQLERFYAEMSEEKESKQQVHHIHQTAASRGHATAAKKATQQEEEKVLFKLGKFLRTKSKVDHSRGVRLFNYDGGSLAEDIPGTLSAEMMGGDQAYGGADW